MTIKVSSFEFSNDHGTVINVSINADAITNELGDTIVVEINDGIDNAIVYLSAEDAREIAELLAAMAERIAPAAKVSANYNTLPQPFSVDNPL